MSKHALRGNTTKRERLRAQAFKMYGKTCNYCGDIGQEVDHVTELAAGGEDSIENLQVLCRACHKAKTSAFNSKRMRAHTGTRGVFSCQSAHISGSACRIFAHWRAARVAFWKSVLMGNPSCLVNCTNFAHSLGVFTMVSRERLNLFP